MISVGVDVQAASALNVCRRPAEGRQPSTFRRDVAGFGRSGEGPRFSAVTIYKLGANRATSSHFERFEHYHTPDLLPASLKPLSVTTPFAARGALDRGLTGLSSSA